MLKKYIYKYRNVVFILQFRCYVSPVYYLIILNYFRELGIALNNWLLIQIYCFLLSSALLA